MKIWLGEESYRSLMDERATRPELAGVVRCGTSGGATTVDGVRVLAEFKDSMASVDGAINGVLIPAFCNAHPKILCDVAALGVLTYLTINGLGEMALANSIKCLNEQDMMLLFDADGVSEHAYLEQLAWLSGSERKFAVRSSRADRLMIAAVLKPEALILEQPVPGLANSLWAIALLNQKNVLRPLSDAEVDAGRDNEQSLSVSTPLAVGDVLTKETLLVTSSISRGLAPYLRNAVAGKTLRYPIEPGEPLTFGHLE